MKQIISVFPVIFFLFALLFILPISDARFLPPLHQVEGKVNRYKIINEGSFLEKEEDSLLDLMGSERCNEKDEECLKRRMVVEAHLDYIYTQHHKP